MAKLTFQCDACGADVQRTPTQAKAGKRHFCNFACKGAWQAANRGGEASPCFTSTKVPCNQCGKEITRSPSRLKQYTHQFCDTVCMGKWQSEHRVGDANYSWRGGKIDVTCAHCGHAFQDYLSNRQGHNAYFCNRQCQSAWFGQHFRGENSPTWKGGTIEYYGPNWRAQRRSARKRDKNTCQCCGKTEKQMKRAMAVHHIKPFREFGYIPGVNDTYLLANDLTNLVSLCMSCHRRAENGQVNLQLRLL